MRQQLPLFFKRLNQIKLCSKYVLNTTILFIVPHDWKLYTKVLHDVKLIPTSFMTLNWQWTWVCLSMKTRCDWRQRQTKRQELRQKIRRKYVVVIPQDVKLTKKVQLHDLKIDDGLPGPNSGPFSRHLTEMVLHNQCPITTLNWRWSFKTKVCPLWH